jgi:hypothetical protein
VSGWEIVRKSENVSLEPGFSYQMLVYCPIGKKVLGGGGTSNGAGAVEVYLTGSIPIDPYIDRSVWFLRWVNDYSQPRSVSLDGYAICAAVN